MSDKRFYIFILIFLGIILLINTSILVILIAQIRKNNPSNIYRKTSSPDLNSVNSIDNNNVTYNNYSTDFFKKSAQYAEDVLFGKVFISDYGNPSFYGNKLITILGKLNNETKNNIKFALSYMLIQPNKIRENEQLYRMMSGQEGVPLWFIILRESTKMIVPEINLIEDSTYENKIVPISSNVA